MTSSMQLRAAGAAHMCYGVAGGRVGNVASHTPAKLASLDLPLVLSGRSAELRQREGGRHERKHFDGRNREAMD
jgi:hypothetical protein